MNRYPLKIFPEDPMMNAVTIYALLILTSGILLGLGLGLALTLLV